MVLGSNPSARIFTENPEGRPEKPVVIRTAKPDDVPDIQKVFYETWLKTYPNEDAGITEDDVHDRFKDRFSMETLAKRRESIEKKTEDEQLIVADVDGKIIGLIRVSKKDGQNRLGALYVLPQHQKQGIGQMLWEEGRKFFPSGEDVFVNVAEYNKNAIEFYRRIGFKDTGRRFSDDRFKMKSGNTIPEMEMVLKS